MPIGGRTVTAYLLGIVALVVIRPVELDRDAHHFSLLELAEYRKRAVAAEVREEQDQAIADERPRAF